jgi:hypothetical protein
MVVSLNQRDAGSAVAVQADHAAARAAVHRVGGIERRAENEEVAPVKPLHRVIAALAQVEFVVARCTGERVVAGVPVKFAMAAFPELRVVRVS